MREGQLCKDDEVPGEESQKNNPSDASIIFNIITSIKI